MNVMTMQRALGAILVAFASLSGVAAHAQGSHAQASYAQGGHAQGAQVEGATEMVEAEVRKLDKGSNKITLKHGPIKNLDMPGMTMVFNVTDPKLLDTVQTGDKVHFTATNEGGKFTVTEIQPVK